MLDGSQPPRPSEPPFEHPAVASSDRTSDLIDLLGEATKHANAVSETSHVAEALAALQARVEAGRFRLAVVGQFKRGKSSLINALLEADVLPTGAIPLTAIATFIAAAPAAQLRATFAQEPPQERAGLSEDDLREGLTELVTERANPRNERGVVQVEIGLDAAILQDGLVLIDTPGVGSTHLHNTEAAQASLPACDAALLVLSPDPPITEAEMQFLAQIRANAVALIVVMNKVDVVTDAERAEIGGFVRSVLDEAGVHGDVLPVSSRQARTAQATGDAAALAESGIEALRARLADLVVDAQRSLLMRSASRKAAALVRELMFETAVLLKAVELPIAELEQRVEAFAVVGAAVKTDRIALADAIAGERGRLLSFVDEIAARRAGEARRRLEEGLLKRTGRETAASGSDALAEAPAVFEAALGAATDELQVRLRARLEPLQERSESLVERVRRSAAGLFDLAYHPAERLMEVDLKRPPYWVDRQRETLLPTSVSALDPLLPRAVRLRRSQARAQAAIAEVVTRNVENLRWALRQAVEDVLRGFSRAIDTQLASHLELVDRSAERARVLRRQTSDASDPEIERLRRRAGELDDLAARLAVMGRG